MAHNSITEHGIYTLSHSYAIAQREGEKKKREGRAAKRLHRCARKSECILKNTYYVRVCCHSKGAIIALLQALLQLCSLTCMQRTVKTSCNAPTTVLSSLAFAFTSLLSGSERSRSDEVTWAGVPSSFSREILIVEERVRPRKKKNGKEQIGGRYTWKNMITRGGRQKEG